MFVYSLISSGRATQGIRAHVPGEAGPSLPGAPVRPGADRDGAAKPGPVPNQVLLQLVEGLPEGVRRSARNPHVVSSSAVTASRSPVYLKHIDCCPCLFIAHRLLYISIYSA